MRAPAIFASAGGTPVRSLELRPIPAGIALLDRSRPVRWILALILAATAIRLALGAAIGLSVDDSYAAVMGRGLSVSYFDHPPMVFWWTGLATRFAMSESPLVVRLPFLAAFIGTIWLLYQLGGFPFGMRAGLCTALLLNVSLFLSVAAGGWALPDGLLLLFSVAAAYCLAARPSTMVTPHRESQPSPSWPQRRAGGSGSGCPPALPCSPNTTGCSMVGCSDHLWQRVYHLSRLLVKQDCLTVTGVLVDATANHPPHRPDGVRHEPDGDTHWWLKVDPPFASPINDGNTPIPAVGTRVVITGTFVQEKNQATWSEIHPVSKIEAQ